MFSMTAFARALTRSWIARLRPDSSHSHVAQISNNYARDSLQLTFPEEQIEQNKRFLEASKDGGIWFS